MGGTLDPTNPNQKALMERLMKMAAKANRSAEQARTVQLVQAAALFGVFLALYATRKR